MPKVRLKQAPDMVNSYRDWLLCHPGLCNYFTSGRNERHHVLSHFQGHGLLPRTRVALNGMSHSQGYESLPKIRAASRTRTVLKAKSRSQKQEPPPRTRVNPNAKIHSQDKVIPKGMGHSQELESIPKISRPQGTSSSQGRVASNDKTPKDKNRIQRQGLLPRSRVALKGVNRF